MVVTGHRVNMKAVEKRKLFLHAGNGTQTPWASIS
jgi:hypothetical protein